MYIYFISHQTSHLHIQGSVEDADDLYSLSQGPLEHYERWCSSVVNWVQFHIKDLDDSS